MATQVTNFKCPACTGPLHFVGESGMLECDYCGTKYDVAEIEALNQEKEAKAEEAFTEAEEKKAAAEDSENSEWDMSNLSEDWGEDGASMRAYNCPSCGAELMCDATTAATACPYCDNPTIVPGQFGGTLKPDLIIPFKLDKEAAKKALSEHYGKKILLPKVFKDKNHLEEIKGIYVPFWLYDIEADGECRFDATISSSRRDGDYVVTKTKYYDVVRGGNVEFQNIPADGSSKMNDDYMDSIEPFDYSEMKPFSTAYLPGYLADRYDVSAQDNAERADSRSKTSLKHGLEADVTGYSSVSCVSSSINLNHSNIHYAFLPVWTLRTKWEDKEYMFMMNGQTGKLVGDLPMDKKKFWGFFAGITAALAVILTVTGIGSAIAATILEMILG